MHACQDVQRSTELSLDAELDVGVEPVANHACPGAVELELALDGVHHGLAGLSQRQGRLSRRVNNGVVARTSSEEEVMVHGQRGICVGGEEDGTSLDIVHGMRELEVVDVKVEAAQDNADLGVEQGAVGDALEVLGGDVPPKGLVRAADVGDPLGLELLLDAGLADDEDLVLALGQLQDARDVDGGRVAGAKDVVLLAGDAQVGELLEVLVTGLCRVVCDEDGSLSLSSVSLGSLALCGCDSTF